MADGNPPFDAKFGFFSIVDSDGTTTRDLSSFLTGVDGLPGARELLDTSKITDSGRTWTPSLVNATFVLEGYYDNTTGVPNGPSVVLDNILLMSTATTFSYGPTGNTSDQTPASRQYSGSCWIKSNPITGRVASAVSFRAEGQVEGTLTIGTFT